MGIAALYAGLVDDARIRRRMLAILRRSSSAPSRPILSVTGQRRLLGREPVLLRSVELRNPYIDPLNFIQVDMIRRLRGGAALAPGEAEAVRAVIELTINGISGGLKNTGLGAARFLGGGRHAQPTHLPTPKTQAVILSKSDFEAILHARHGSAHSVLGMHPLTYRRSRGLVVRALLRDAAACEVVLTDAPGGARGHPMKRLAPEGLFEVFIPDAARVFTSTSCGPPTLTGSCAQIPRSLLLPADPRGTGSLPLQRGQRAPDLRQARRPHSRPGRASRVSSFAVWAPSAARVSVVGDFNGWDGRYHPMRSLGASGVWEIFIPGLETGSLYKFEIRDRMASSA